VEEVTRRVQESFVRLLREQPGFRDYYYREAAANRDRQLLALMT
jgi:hypothetical protein